LELEFLPHLWRFVIYGVVVVGKARLRLGYSWRLLKHPLLHLVICGEGALREEHIQY
jgi:hypothetical protein